jgi:hypothetical protein
MKHRNTSPVQDGIQDPEHPVPRDPEERQRDPKERQTHDDGGGDLGGEATGQAGTSGSKDPSGPAEDADDAVEDDRSLTTKLSPSD